MSSLAINLLLAFVWAALQRLSLGNLVVGFALGFAVLTLARPFIGSAGYVRSVGAVVRLAFAFALDFLRANLRLARDALRIEPRFAPAFLRIDVSDLSPNQAAVLAALVSLTPGSITVDADDGGTMLFVHTVYAHDAARARDEIRRLASLLRDVGRR